MQYTLKELRARKNVTQAEVATAIGVSAQTYNAWEKDISNVSIIKVAALAKYFGVKLGDIFFTDKLENNSIENVSVEQEAE